MLRISRVGELWILAVFISSIVFSVRGSSAAEYSLFNPVPAAKLRELSTDRPGKSHSTVTVDAGHYQIESDFVNVTYDPKSVGTTTFYSLGTPIVKLGVNDRIDVELGLSLFNYLSRKDDGHYSGFGDTLVGAKVNMLGKDGGDYSWALLPFMKIPTARAGLGNQHYEAALNAPFTIAANKPWSLTIEPNLSVIRNEDNSAYTTGGGLIVNLSRPVLVKGLTAAVELAVGTRADREPTRWSFDPSLQYLIDKNLQIDAGIYIGLNRATPRYNPYVGVSYRFE